MLLIGHVLDKLAEIPAESVQCVVTSPPYWGLRDYSLPPVVWGGCHGCVHEWVPSIEPGGQGSGKSFRRDRKAGRKRGGLQVGICQLCGAWTGQLGLEPTPELYIQHIVEVFREVRRVMRKDGTLFLNLGDSYFSSGQREGVYDTSDKAPEGSQDHGCLCQNLCDVCRVVYQNHRFHNDGLLSAMLVASLSAPNQGNKESESGRFPTLDFSLLESHILIAIRDLENFLGLSAARLRAFQESMPDEFSGQFLVACLQRARGGECLLCACSLSDYVNASADKTACTCDTGGPLDASGHHKTGRFSSGLAYPNLTTTSLKPKDLIGMPWRVALALQADGWWLRSDIIWSKPNPMPESCRDRPTSAHEHIFLLTKSARYFYDAEAVREPAGPTTKMPDGWATHAGDHGSFHRDGREKGKRSAAASEYPGSRERDENRRRKWPGIGPQHAAARNRGEKYEPMVTHAGRNQRNVWTIATQPFPKAHFATFPEEIPRRAILAGTSARGCCPECRAPWERVVDREFVPQPDVNADRGKRNAAGNKSMAHRKDGDMPRGSNNNTTAGWRPTCDHSENPVPCVVLDPFAGSGTVGKVATELGREWILIEMSQEYVPMIEERVTTTVGLPL